MVWIEGSDGSERRQALTMTRLCCTYRACTYILVRMKRFQDMMVLRMRSYSPLGLWATDKDLYCFSGSCTKCTDSWSARQILLASSTRMSRECKTGPRYPFLIGRLTWNPGPAGNQSQDYDQKENCTSMTYGTSQSFISFSEVNKKRAWLGSAQSIVSVFSFNLH